MIIRWPGKIPAGKVENAIISGLDWFPTFVAAAGNPNIVDELKKGKQIGDRTYKVHLDGYNQMDLITGKGPSKRNEIWYFTKPRSLRRVSATSSIGSPISRRVVRQHGQGRLANPRQPPARPVRAHRLTGRTARWYYQLVHVRVLARRLRAAGKAKLGQTFIDFPPLQKGASFNLEALKEELREEMAARRATRRTRGSKRMMP